jgi:ABC-type branched-subunit amino acid transport system permease subunit
MVMKYVFPAVLLLAAINPLLFPHWDAFLIIVFAKALPVLGLILLLRAGQVSFGHAMFFAIGAYTAGFIGRSISGVDIALMLVAALGVSTLCGLFVGIFVVRYRYIFFGMLNLAFSMVLFSVLEKMIHITGGSDGLRIARPAFLGQQFSRGEFELAFYYLSLLLLAISVFGVAKLLDSPIGNALKAIKSNEVRVEYIGISPRRTLLVGYVVSAALAGLGGALVGIFQGMAFPGYAYWTQSGEFIFVAILGGAGHVLGALAGSYAFEFIRVSAVAHMGDIWQLTLGMMLLGTILFAPSGIVGSLIKMGTHIRRRRATVQTSSGGEVSRVM